MTEPIQTFVCQDRELATHRYLAAKIFPHLTYFSAVRALPKFTEILPILEFSDEERQHFSQKHQVRANLNLFDKNEADRIVDALIASDLPPKRFIGQYERWLQLREIYPTFAEFDQLRKRSWSQSHRKNALSLSDSHGMYDYSYSKHKQNYQQKDERKYN